MRNAFPRGRMAFASVTPEEYERLAREVERAVRSNLPVLYLVIEGGLALPPTLGLEALQSIAHQLFVRHAKREAARCRQP
jgi:hypothetical protein